MKNKVMMRICGKEYAVVGQESDEYIQKVSLYIDRKMNEVIKANSKLSTAQAAVLTSINVADDYYKTLEAYNTIESEYSRFVIEHERIKKEKEDLKREVDKQSQKLRDFEIKTACLETELKGKS